MMEDLRPQREICPLLLDPKGYSPDTIDLLTNETQRNYWLPCLDKMVKTFVSKAGELNPSDPQATEKAENCYRKFHELVQSLESESDILKPLSVRTLLEFHEDNLQQNDLKDSWGLQKQKETKAAMLEFDDRIKEIDGISDFHSKWVEIVKGLLAGNLFDWGSKTVADILDKSNNFGLRQALNTIEERPWFHDDLDHWIERIEKEQYKSAVIFVDNAGVDFVLGILPLVRELLIHGTKVLLTANTSPALNDVTYREMNSYLSDAADICSVIKKALDSRQLLASENGQKGPCLDLTSLSPELCDLMSSADLIILEGMGRAVHTNLYAKFKVDSVKLAVLKNEWLAKSLGAKQFSVIFNYEQAP